MARTKSDARTRSDGQKGHDTDDIIDTVPEELKCAICTEVCREPSSCCREGHDFCASCLKEWVRKKGTCPSCREKVGKRKTLTKNRLGCSMVANLAVRCPRHAAGDAGDAGGGAGAASSSAGASGSEKGGERRKRAREGAVKHFYAAADAANAATSEGGCEWTGKVSGLDEHASVCAFVEVRPSLFILRSRTRCRLPRKRIPPHLFRLKTTKSFSPPLHTLLLISSSLPTLPPPSPSLLPSHLSPSVRFRASLAATMFSPFNDAG